MLGTLLLLGTFAHLWLTYEPLRTALLLLPLGVLLLAKRGETRLRFTLAVIGVFVLLPFLAALILPSFQKSAQPLLSPNGRWAVTYRPETTSEEGRTMGGALYLSPRGLASRDPRAYPSRTLVDFNSVTTPTRITWTAPHEITLDLSRISDDGPIVNKDLGIRIRIEE